MAKIIRVIAHVHGGTLQTVLADALPDGYEFEFTLYDEDNADTGDDLTTEAALLEEMKAAPNTTTDFLF